MIPQWAVIWLLVGLASAELYDYGAHARGWGGVGKYLTCLFLGPALFTMLLVATIWRRIKK